MKSLSKLHAEAITKAQTEQAKVKAAAVAMIEKPMDMIQAILLKHEEAVIEVMSDLHKRNQRLDEALRVALEALEDARQSTLGPKAALDMYDNAITKIREVMP